MVERGLAPSRERAQALILAGLVRVDGRPAGKPGTLVAVDAEVRRDGADHPFVGRGGVKLEGAITSCRIEVAGRVALDIGASTGGFTDCLLKRGAPRVYALDVGRGLLDWSLRTDARVVLLEGRNARHLAPGDLPEPVDLVVIDVSFISLRLILPPLPPLLAPGADVLALVKPQFEVGRGEVGRGGIVRAPEKHLKTLRTIALAAEAAGFRIRGACASPLRGAEGNREFGRCARRPPGRDRP
ncbi:MAG: TlyA family rRNA (cytidine-2'-O)-methyltransferase [Acidobacteria bacterium 13_1_40CM_4_69_4]|nr:MAG: TlyA family rRNA (cytidine-2'-O)-methyltransferase [Acidobacteria bacterium 13_1_40CM_4_69_4]